MVVMIDEKETAFFGQINKKSSSYELLFFGFIRHHR